MQTYKFSLVDFENNVKLITNEIQQIDRTYIKRIKDEAYNAIKNSDYESAITKSRTLLEEVLIMGIEHQDINHLKKEISIIYINNLKIYIICM